ncbi:serine/threonine-protein kinase [Streptomyces sp. NPDC007983]|uniref:serine/threonine-protein kinase n=1 Tax=Streptomyces sp. NPDC007983 TaxID=3364800 RepID=UPI0036EE11FE
MNLLGSGDPLRLGPYRLLGVLGEGGMGKVYLGRDGSGRAAAVKVLRPELAYDEHMSQRFVREAQAAQAVASTGVARVLGAWTEGGRPWIATEFLAGPTLDDAIEEQGPFDEQGVAELAHELARTLQDIHNAGLVHRDLKPSNIVMTSSGPRVIDFGIARPEHGLTLTSTGQIPVTPGYGAPEQVMGQRVGPPGDVFSLGAVLAYAASGERAYQGGHVAAVQYAVVHGRPDLSEVPDSIRALIGPCLVKDPAQRPLPQQIAAAFAPPPGSKAKAKRVWQLGSLAAEIKRREAAAKQLTTFPEIRTPTDPAAPSRRKFIATLAAGGTVLAAGGGGAAWWLLSKDGDAVRNAIADEKEAAVARKPWDAKRLKPSQYEKGTAPPSLWGPQGASLMASAPVVAGDRVVVEETSRSLGGYDVADGSRRWTVECGSQARCAAPSDDLVVTVEDDLDGKLLALDSGTGKKKWTVSAEALGVIGADAETVYFMASSTGHSTDIDRLGALDLAERAIRWTVPMPVECSTITPPLVAAGSGRLVICGESGKVVTLDTRTGKVAWKLSRRTTVIAPIAPAVSEGVVYLGGPTLTARKIKDGKEVWSLPAKSELSKSTGGWGPPAIDGDALYAQDGSEISRRDKRDGKTDWAQHTQGDTVPQLVPLVVQGTSLWATQDTLGEKGVAVFDKDTGEKAWAYSRGQAGDWLMVGAGNRVFLARMGSVTAMPVF